MKRFLSAVLLVSIVMPLVANADFRDSANETYGFGSGTYSNSQWDSGNSWLELDSTGLSSGSGTYTSRIFDAKASTSWSTFAWTPSQPYLKELPNSATSETAYSTGNANMSNNVLLMHMNESSGSLSDTSGSSITGTVTGATHSATGKFNTALSFDGNDYVSLGDVLESTISSQYTVSAWVYPTSGTNETIISKYNPTSSKRQWIFGISSSKPSFTMYGALGGATYRQYQSNSTISLNAWHHIVYVGDNSGNDYHIYVDGSEVAGTKTTAGSFSSIQDSNESVIVGAAQAGANYNINGTIDELAVFGRNLSATEILNLYKRGANRLRFQVMSCDDAACSGESFVGPGGSGSTYFEEQDANSISLPSFSLSGVVSDNRYFRYRATFETDNTSYTPDITNVAVGSPSIGVLYSNFSTSYGTTNLSGVNNIGATPNFKLGTMYGSIQWTDVQDVRQQDFDSTVAVGDSYVSVDAASLPTSFDAQATVTFAGVDCENYLIYYDNAVQTSAAEVISNGQACDATSSPACTNISCTSSTLTFTAPHFDSFAVDSGGTPTPGVPELPAWPVLFVMLAGMFWYVSRATLPQNPGNFAS